MLIVAQQFSQIQISFSPYVLQFHHLNSCQALKSKAMLYFPQ
jgi:hypothetical protein